MAQASDAPSLARVSARLLGKRKNASPERGETSSNEKEIKTDILNDFPQLSCGAIRQRRYRTKIKQDEEKLKVYREKENQRFRDMRQAWSDEKRAEMSKAGAERCRKCREKKKARGEPLNTKPQKPKTRASISERREKERIRKQKYRARLSSQKKASSNSGSLAEILLLLSKKTDALSGQCELPSFRNATVQATLPQATESTESCLQTPTRPEQEDDFVVRGQERVAVLAQAEAPSSPTVTPQPGCHNGSRRVREGMGCQSTVMESFRTVVTEGKGSTHNPVQDDGGLEHSASFSSSADGQKMVQASDAPPLTRVSACLLDKQKNASPERGGSSSNEKKIKTNFLNDFPQLSRRAVRQRRYRAKMKEDEEKLKLYREKENQRFRDMRQAWSVEKRAEMSKAGAERCRKCREKKKARGEPINTKPQKPKTKARGEPLNTKPQKPKTRASVSERREKERIRKQKYRARLNSQKKASSDSGSLAEILLLLSKKTDALNLSGQCELLSFRNATGQATLPQATESTESCLQTPMRPEQEDDFGVRGQVRVAVLAQAEAPSSPTVMPQPGCHNGSRRIQKGVGCQSTVMDSFRTVVTEGKGSTHNPVQDEGSLECSARFSSSADGQVCVCTDWHQNNGGISIEGGGDKIQSTLWSLFTFLLPMLSCATQ